MKKKTVRYLLRKSRPQCRITHRVGHVHAAGVVGGLGLLDRLVKQALVVEQAARFVA